MTSSRADAVPAAPAPASGDPRSVARAMITRPKTLPHLATLGEVRAALADSHVHLLLLVRGDLLVGTIDRDDVPPAGPGTEDSRPALPHATLTGRTTHPDADAEQLRQSLRDARARRLAVVDGNGRLLGLLCLKRTGSGFCSDADVAAREAGGPDPRA